MYLTKFIPTDWGMVLQNLIIQYEINTPNRIAGFLSQVDHESAHFTRIEENLNYSAQRLVEVYPKYFDRFNAPEYDRKPEAIANLVYSNRMGNGSPWTGDGYKYRGRGLIQLTGLSNYNAFALACGKSTDETVIYLSTKEGAAHSACWFWSNNNINHFADIGDVYGMTKKINGGSNGLKERTALYEKYKAELCSV
jgi:putative chitinase